MIMKEMKAIYIIWLRESKRFFRERARVLGMLGQPLLYLLIVGNGMAAAFSFRAAPEGFNYLVFMYPGIIGQSVLFTSIFSAMSIIWDREFGFLKEVLVAPVPRWSIAVGKALGGSTVSVMQAAVLLLLAPLLGVSISFLTIFKLLALMFLISFAITSFGISIAARMHSMEGFQMIMNFLILPLFFLSGALFPLRGVAPWMEWLMKIDPLTYGVDALRHIMYAGYPGKYLMLQFSLGTDLAVTGTLALAFITVGALAFNRLE